MAYVVLGFGAVFVFYWLLALIFVITTKGERSFVIPGVWIVVFGGVAAFGFGKLSEAQNNPPKITSGQFVAIKQGSSPEDVRNLLGFDSDFDPTKPHGFDKLQLKKYDLAGNRISLPAEVTSVLSPGVFYSERTEARIAIQIDGEPSKRGERNKTEGPLLGADAVESKRTGHGLKGSVIRFFIPDEEAAETQREERIAARKEKPDEDYPPLVIPAKEGMSWTFTEGSVKDVQAEKADWSYDKKWIAEYLEWDDEEAKEAELNAEAVAKVLVKLIDSTDEWRVEYDEDEAATKLVIYPNAFCSDNQFKKEEDCTGGGGTWNEDLLGASSNELRAQVDTGFNMSITLGRSVQGEAQRFIGGADSVRLEFWYEEDPLLDDDFSTTPRLVAAGFVDDKLFGLGSNGLNLAEVTDITTKEAECQDGIDSDNDFRTDCEDPECQTSTYCREKAKAEELAAMEAAEKEAAAAKAAKEAEQNADEE